MRRFAASLLTASATLAPAAGLLISTAHATAQPENAALAYWPLFDRVDANLVDRGWEAMKESEKLLAPGTSLAQELVDSGDVVQTAVRAASVRDCDFEIDYSEGFETLLPHLGQMRRLAKLVAVDARRLELAGDVDGAAKRTGALYRMAGHLAEDGVLISSLVAIVIGQTANDQAERLLALNPSETARRDMLEGIIAIDDGDPYDVLSSVAMEQEIVRTWLRQKFSGEDAAVQFFDMMRSFEEPTTDEGREVFEAMSQTEFYAQVDQAADVYSIITAAIYAPDREQRFASLDAALQAGEYGQVALQILPSFEHAADRTVASRDDLARVRAKLEAPTTAQPQGAAQSETGGE